MHLFSPLKLGPARISNRIAMSPSSSGCASVDGSISPELVAFYLARARHGAGLIVLEAGWPVRPNEVGAPHLGLYDDIFVPPLTDFVDQLHHLGSCVVVSIDQPLDTDSNLAALPSAWSTAANRALAAGADGIMLSCAGDGVFRQLLSPLTNQRTDAYGGSLERRMRLLQDVVERLHMRFGGRMLLALRLLVDEFTPRGVTLQDARVVARRMVGAGIGLVEVHASPSGSAHVAEFPGWRVPLASAIRSIIDAPVMVGGLLSDPELADSIIRDHSADVVALGDVLHDDPEWPALAHAALHPSDDD